MGTGSFDLDNNFASLAGDALAVNVYTYDPDAGYSLLPNVRVLRIDRREGCFPSVARFAYWQDDALEVNFGWPARFEDLFPINASPSPYAVQIDQRVVVLAQNPDGSPWLLFDGFASVPQVDLDRRGEPVTFAAIGVEVRCWDSPLSGRTQRDSDSVGIVDASGDSDVDIDVRPRFNPNNGHVGSRAGQLPNKTPKGKDTGSVDDSDDFPAPVFVDSGDETQAGRPTAPDYWVVSDAVKYILRDKNKAQEYVDNPPFGALGDLLQAVAPAKGKATVDPNDPSSYTLTPVRVQDFDAQNHPWPDAVSHLIAYCGFLARFDCYADADGLPVTLLTFYRRDEFTTALPKLVYLDAAGTQTLDPTRNNVTGINLAIDANAIVNQYQVETAQRLMEVSWILAPLYQPKSGDEQSADRRRFKRANLAQATADVRRKYRWYGADELGEGHQDGINTGSEGFVKTPCDFLPVFPLDDDGLYTYVNRYRPGSNTLLTVDDDGNPRRADLSISFDYQGDWQAPWDGTGTWYSIQGGWRLLDDRLGIEVTANDPEEWATGADQQIGAGGAGGAGIFGGGSIRGITWWANPPSGGPTNGQAPSLRLTTVIADDRRIASPADKRIASPTRFTRERIADRRDEFVLARLHPSSMYYQALAAAGGGILTGGQSGPIAVRDDTDAATALAEQLRAAREMPTLSGTITIPYITDYYTIGDRIQEVAGRDCGLTTNIAGDQGEAPSLPWVVGVTWTFTEDRQQTVLSLSDAAVIPRHGRHFDRRAVVRHA